jgi:hypothetical protein
MTSLVDEFADIRPYSDHEVRDVLDAMLRDDELIATIANLRLKSLYSLFPWIVKPLLRAFLRKEFAGVNTVEAFQHKVKIYMDRMIEKTTTGFTVSGLDALAVDKPYLFISNHRDIALDPAFVNYALYHNDHETVRIAIGDNLLSKPFAADLMRLNKSFIVKRSAKGPRQMLATYKQLSAYIRYSIDVDNNPIWIAQREGRAKDGLDRTEPAIIKMLTMAMNKETESFSDYIRHLHIVPVSISYEFDPCDGAKARELFQKAHEGGYQKGEHEDLTSIALGISGQKGAVHVSFGTPLDIPFNDADEVASTIDKQVINNYVLHPTSFFAWHALHGNYPDLPCGAEAKLFDPQRYAAEGEQFAARIAALPEPHRPYALAIYANAIASKLELAN